MYLSPILKKALRHVYNSKLWRDALCLTFHRVHQGFEYNEFDLNSDVEGSWSSCPPPSLVAFVGTLVMQIQFFTLGALLMHKFYRSPTPFTVSSPESMAPASPSLRTTTVLPTCYSPRMLWPTGMVPTETPSGKTSTGQFKESCKSCQPLFKPSNSSSRISRPPTHD
jgi:hypothetical protein